MGDKSQTGEPRTDIARIFLVVVDESQEMSVALHFACRRAARTGGRVALLYVQEPAEFQHWMAVGDLMREEAREEAEGLLQKMSAEVQEWAGSFPIVYLREGVRREELEKLLAEEPTISVLVLGSSTEAAGPGPLISSLFGKSGITIRIPITIVPGSLSDEDILALT